MYQQSGHGPHHDLLVGLSEETGAVAAALVVLTPQGVVFELAACPQVLPVLGQKLRAAADQLSPPDPSPLWERIQAVCPN